MVEERNNGGNGDPQWTTRGVGEELDESVAAAGGPIAGPGEGQGGVPRKAAPRRRPRRKAATAAPTKKKNAGQLKNPRDRKARQLGPTGRARAGVGKRPKGKDRTAAGRRRGTKKGSPAAKRRMGNRRTPRRGR